MSYTTDTLQKQVVDELGGMLKFRVEHDPLWGDLIVFPNRVIAKEIVQFYKDEDKHMYKSASEIEKMTQYLQVFPPPISWEHPSTDTLTSLKEPVGFIRDPHYKDGRSVTDLVYVRKWLGEDRYQDLIMGKKPDVSIGFFYEDDMTEGEFDGVPYQSGQCGIYVNHIATTSKGRCSIEDGCGLMVRYDSAKGRRFGYDSISLSDTTLYVDPDLSGFKKVGGGQLTPAKPEFQNMDECVGYYVFAHQFSREDARERCLQKFPEMQQDNYMQTLNTCVEYYINEQGLSPAKAEEQCEKVFSMSLLGSSYEMREKAKARWRGDDALQECVSRLIPKIKESDPDKPHEQQIAIAYSKCWEQQSGDSADVQFKRLWDAVNTYELPMIKKVEMALNIQKVVEGMS